MGRLGTMADGCKGEGALVERKRSRRESLSCCNTAATFAACVTQETAHFPQDATRKGKDENDVLV